MHVVLMVAKRPASHSKHFCRYAIVTVKALITVPKNNNNN